MNNILLNLFYFETDDLFNLVEPILQLKGNKVYTYHGAIKRWNKFRLEYPDYRTFLNKNNLYLNGRRMKNKPEIEIEPLYLYPDLDVYYNIINLFNVKNHGIVENQISFYKGISA